MQAHLGDALCAPSPMPRRRQQAPERNQGRGNRCVGTCMVTNTRISRPTRVPPDKKKQAPRIPLVELLLHVDPMSRAKLALAGWNNNEVLPLSGESVQPRCLAISTPVATLSRAWSCHLAKDRSMSAADGAGLVDADADNTRVSAANVLGCKCVFDLLRNAFSNEDLEVSQRQTWLLFSQDLRRRRRGFQCWCVCGYTRRKG